MEDTWRTKHASLNKQRLDDITHFWKLVLWLLQLQVWVRIKIRVGVYQFFKVLLQNVCILGICTKLFFNRVGLPFSLRPFIIKRHTNIISFASKCKIIAFDFWLLKTSQKQTYKVTRIWTNKKHYIVKVNLHSIRFSYVFASVWQSMRFFIRIFISPYPHEVDCYI